eukprot:SAG31_NODE_1271_length_9064_cov_10.148912_7_plen_63_part_00
MRGLQHVQQFEFNLMSDHAEEVARLTREVSERDEERQALDIRIGQLQSDRDTACTNFEQLKV